ncbi:MAG: hypothetical protein HXS53_10490 [Theionarchaea archaeon]|nr:hypothetical protein [Theionarchaea archaeon]
MKVPSFLLKKLYMKDSLKNTENGFEFTIKNVLMDGTITNPMTLSVDNRAIDPASITVSTGDLSLSTKDISESQQLPLKVDVEVKISIKGTPLNAGTHSLDIVAPTKEFGDIEFTIEDSIH